MSSGCVRHRPVNYGCLRQMSGRFWNGQIRRRAPVGATRVTQMLLYCDPCCYACERSNAWGQWQRAGSSVETSDLELGHIIMCRMTCGNGNHQREGVTGHSLTRTVSDLLRSRMPFLLRNAGRLAMASRGSRIRVKTPVGGDNGVKWPPSLRLRPGPTGRYERWLFARPPTYRRR